MFGPKKNGEKDTDKKNPYLQDVANIIQMYIKPSSPMVSAYNMVEQCQMQLEKNIELGTFSPGPEPKTKMMAYYCLCSCIANGSTGPRTETLFKLSIVALLMKAELDDYDDMSDLEKGLWEFGEHILKKYCRVHVIKIGGGDSPTKKNKKPSFDVQKFKNITKETKFNKDEMQEYLKSPHGDIDDLTIGAKAGNLTCQMVMADMLLVVMKNFNNETDISLETLTGMEASYERYTTMAAKQGDPQSQFNLAKTLFGKVDMSKDVLDVEDINNLAMAKRWYLEAQKNGHDDTEKSLALLNDMLYGLDEKLRNSLDGGEGSTLH